MFSPPTTSNAKVYIKGQRSYDQQHVSHEMLLPPEQINRKHIDAPASPGGKRPSWTPARERKIALANNGHKVGSQ